MTIFQNKEILIFGSAGFIGSNLCNILIKEDIKKLIIFDNLSASSTDNIKHLLNDERVEFIKGDICDYSTIEECILNNSIDFIFNLAASNVGNSIINPIIDSKTNVIGTLNILKIIKKYPSIRMIHTSSGSVKNPSTPYAINKLAGEQLCLFFAKEYNLKISVIRPYHVFGPNQSIDGKCGVVNIFLNRILKGLPPIIWGDGSQRKRFTYVQDTIKAILLLAEKDKSIGKVYDVASSTDISIKKLAKLLIKNYAQDEKMKPIYDKPKVGENTQLYPDVSQIKRLGWKEKWDFDYGLAVTKKWVEQKIKDENYV